MLDNTHIDSITLDTNSDTNLHQQLCQIVTINKFKKYNYLNLRTLKKLKHIKILQNYY